MTRTAKTSISGGKIGQGDSSMIFWWRRWMLQYAHPKATTSPAASATAAPRRAALPSTHASKNTPCSKRSRCFLLDRTQGPQQIRHPIHPPMPRPPPPADAFTINGNPTPSAISSDFASDWPSSTKHHAANGTSQASASRFASNIVPKTHHRARRRPQKQDPRLF